MNILVSEKQNTDPDSAYPILMILYGLNRITIKKNILV